MIATETSTTGELKARPLRQDDAPGIAQLIAEYFSELGASGNMSPEQMEQLFAQPWLEGGFGFVLEMGTDTVGYGFARPSQWKGNDTVQVGLTLGHGFRGRETYRVLTDPLMAAALAIANRDGIDNLSIHLRSTDTFHPPVLLELGFREHPVSMLGFRHDLRHIPPRLLPPGLSFRLARLPEENATVLQLTRAAFDDRDRQGEPIDATYLDLVAAKRGFEPEQVLLAESGGSPVGCAILDASSHGPGHNYAVLELVVLPGFRRRGIGSALVCRQLEWLKAHGARAAVAGMFSTNIAATLFWRLGFRPEPQSTHHFFVFDVALPPARKPRRPRHAL
jgi:predicted N-acetyltransferase YhbS